jgi:hypothetical protein
MPLLAAVDALVEHRGLADDLEVAATVELARSLARKIDQARVSGSAAMLTGVAAATRELRAVLVRLDADRGDAETQAWLAGLFVGVDDSAGVGS